jgi:hypothetical protein
MFNIYIIFQADLLNEHENANGRDEKETDEQKANKKKQKKRKRGKKNKGKVRELDSGAESQSSTLGKYHLSKNVAEIQLLTNHLCKHCLLALDL